MSCFLPLEPSVFLSLTLPMSMPIRVGLLFDFFFCVLSMHCLMEQHIPLASINHKFEPIAQRKDRLIVYNKTDLAHPDTEAVSPVQIPTSLHACQIKGLNLLFDSMV